MSKFLGTIAVAIIVIISLSVLIWGFDKGFNISDGGFYVLRYQQIQPSVPLSYYQFDNILVKAIIPQSMRTILSLRYIGFGLNLLSTIFFAYVISLLYLRIHRARIKNTSLILLMLAGFIMSYPGMPSELSYNSLNQLFLINCSSLLLLTMMTRGRQSNFLAFFSGIACCLIYVSKPSSGITMTVFSSLILVLSNPKDIKRLLLFWMPQIFGILLFIVLVRPDILHILKNYIPKSGDYTLSFFLKSAFQVIQMLVVNLVLAMLISYALKLFNKSNGESFLSKVALVTGVLLISVYFSVQVFEHVTGSIVRSNLFVQIIGILFFHHLFNYRSSSVYPSHFKDFINKHKLLLMVTLFLVVVPYIGAFGSFVPLNWISKYYFTTFMGLIALLIPYMKSKYTMLISHGVCIYLIGISLYNYIQYPYAYEPGHKPLYEQTVYYKGIRHSPERAKYYRTTEYILENNGFETRQGLIIPYSSPGIAYLMNTYHVGGILWRANVQEGYFALLKRTKLLYKPVIISIYGPPDEKFRVLLNAATGIDFDIDYRLVASYKCFNNRDVTHVYFPIEELMHSRAL